MQKEYKILISTACVLDLEQWLIKNRIGNFTVFYTEGVSSIVFHNSQDYLVYKIHSPSFDFKPIDLGLGFSKKLEKKLALYSPADSKKIYTTVS